MSPVIAISAKRGKSWGLCQARENIRLVISAGSLRALPSAGKRTDGFIMVDFMFAFVCADCSVPVERVLLCHIEPWLGKQKSKD